MNTCDDRSQLVTHNMLIYFVVSVGILSSHFTSGLQSKGIDLVAHLCINESTKRNMSKSSENANQPPSFVVSTKSMFQLVSTGDIIGRVQESKLYIYWFCFVDIVVL